MSSTRPTRPALAARYDRRREEIVSGSARVWAERGFDQTPISDLGEAIGLAAGGLYHYVGSKEELLRAICDELLEPLLPRATEIVRGGEGTAAERLRALVRLWVEHVVAHRDHMLVFQQERHVIEHGPQWRGVRASRKAFERLVEEALVAVEREGAAGYDDRRVAISALLGMVNHTAQWFRPRGRLSPAAVADGYANLLLRSPRAAARGAARAARGRPW